MACIPKVLEAAVLEDLMRHEGFDMKEISVVSLLNQAFMEGILSVSSEGGNYIFAHDRFRQASNKCLTDYERNDLLLRIVSSQLNKRNQRIQRSTLFERRYIAIKWEMKELSFLISFFGLVDPSLQKGSQIEDTNADGLVKSLKAPATRNGKGGSVIRALSRSFASTLVSRRNSDDTYDRLQNRSSAIEATENGDVDVPSTRRVGEREKINCPNHLDRLFITGDGVKKHFIVLRG